MEVTRGTLNALYVLIYFHLRPFGDVVDLHRLSASLDVPQSYLSKILQQLHRAGYLVSQMGSKGGYRLAKNVEKTTMRDVMRTMQGENLMQECLDDHFNSDRFRKCAVLHHVREIQEEVNKMLDQLTIGQLAAEMELKDHQTKFLGSLSMGVQ